MRIHPEQLYADLLDYHKFGLPTGCKTGWKTLDQHYTVSPGQWTVVTGVPNHGKSEWLDALMVNLCADKWRFAVFSPENQPLAMHEAKILEKHIGKPFNPGPNERITEEELEDSAVWMNQHFVFIKTDKPNLIDIINEGVEWCGNLSTVKGGVVIDPWNQLEHYRPANMTETEYISQSLSDVIRMCRDWNIHVWIVAHPAKPCRDKDGKQPIPTPYDISGSAHWFNKADNCITVWRDVLADSQIVDVHIQKVRFKHIGRPGLISLRYDRVNGRYYENGLHAVDLIDMKSRQMVDF